VPTLNVHILWSKILRKCAASANYAKQISTVQIAYIGTIYASVVGRPALNSSACYVESEEALFGPLYNNPVTFKNILYIPANWGYDCPSIVAINTFQK
jgi:hypothetical protein